MCVLWGEIDRYSSITFVQWNLVPHANYHRSPWHSQTRIRFTHQQQNDAPVRRVNAHDSKTKESNLFQFQHSLAVGVHTCTCTMPNAHTRARRGCDIYYLCHFIFDVHVKAFIAISESKGVKNIKKRKKTKIVSISWYVIRATEKLSNKSLHWHDTRMCVSVSMCVCVRFESKSRYGW